MDRSYVIKIEPGEGCSEEFAPDKLAREGLKCNGYLLIGFNEDGDPAFDTIYGINVMQIAQALAYRGPKNTFSILWQAFAIAEGLKKAYEIRKQEGGFQLSEGFLQMDAKGERADRLKEALLRGILGMKDGEN